MGRFLRKEYIPTSKFKTNNEWLHHLLILNFINDDISFRSYSQSIGASVAP
jgi:hypothetical protein